MRFLRDWLCFLFHAGRSTLLSRQARIIENIALRSQSRVLSCLIALFSRFTWNLDDSVDVKSVLSDVLPLPKQNPQLLPNRIWPPGQVFCDLHHFGPVELALVGELVRYTIGGQEANGLLRRDSVEI